MTQTYPIYQSLWDSLDTVLFTKGLALAKEISAELNIPVKEIIPYLSIQNNTQFTIIPDEENTVYQCQGLIKCGKVYMRCRTPVLGIAPRYCSKHIEAPIDLPNLPVLKRYITPEQTYLVNPITSESITVNGVQCGFIKENKLIHFDITEKT